MFESCFELWGPSLSNREHPLPRDHGLRPFMGQLMRFMPPPACIVNPFFTSRHRSDLDTLHRISLD
jgi:hypothetical protein